METKNEKLKEPRSNSKNVLFELAEVQGLAFETVSVFNLNGFFDYRAAATIEPPPSEEQENSQYYFS